MEHINTFVKQHYAKLRDLYLSMTFGNRIITALLMATLLLSLGYLIVGSIPPTDPASKTTKIYNGRRFNYNEQRAAENAIAKNSLSGHQWIGDQLLVPTNRHKDFIAALADASVLQNDSTARQTAAEMLTAWQSARLMNEKMTTAKERDSADAIKRVPGIADAQVVSNKRPAWERNVWARTQITSVGVFVEAIDNKPLSADTIGAIGQIIKPMFGITDMREISIVDTKHARAYDGTGEQQGSTQSEYLRHQTRYQETLNNRIYELLPPIAGLKVDTTVALTTYRSQSSFNVEHGRPTPLVTHELDYHLHREGWDRFFRPGQVAQWSRPLIDPTGNVSPKDTLDEKKREQEITHALQGTEMKDEALPYIPLRATASIRIPRDYIVSIWRERNRLLGGDHAAAPTPEELRAEEEAFATDTKRSIGNLLQFYRTSNKTDPMELVDVTFEDRLFPADVELTAWQKFLLFMKEHWQDIGLMSLVFGGLVVLWAISKPPKPETIIINEGHEVPIEALDARLAEQMRLAAEAAAAAIASAEEQQEFENSLGELGSMRTLKDEIAELIAKNPEAAAAVIRQWIGNAVLVEAKT